MSIADENRELERGVSPVPVACHLGGPVAVVTMAKFGRLTHAGGLVTQFASGHARR